MKSDLERLRTDPCHPLTLFHRFGYKATGRYAEQLERLWRYIPRAQTLVIRSEDFFAEPASALRLVGDFLGLEPWQVQFKVYKQGRYSRDEVPLSIERELRAYFRPHNQRLYALLGRDMQWEG